MDTTLVQYLSALVDSHPLLTSVVAGFAGWGVLAFGVAVCGLWLLDEPRRGGVWRVATAQALAAAGLALLANQALGHLWARPRPYESHLDIVPALPVSHDASFPSDHAAAAFAIAVGVFLVHRRAGRIFLAWAALIAVSRVVAGMHYPTDVLAGAAVGAASALLVARLAREPLAWLVRLGGALTDPLLVAARRIRVVSAPLASPAFRAAAVLVAGGIPLAEFAYDLRAHLFDEMPLTVLGAWAVVLAAAAKLATRSPAASPTASP